MLTASLLALALAAAEPSASGSAPERPADLPAGAPSDDYGFVAWCHGALTGHMELRELVKDELDAVSPGDPGDDAAMQKAGEEYLGLYTRAMRAAEQASPTPLQARGRQANQAGYGLWSQARAADPRNRMWAYLMWDLPGRCETVAKNLEERSSLFGEALRSAPATPAPQAAPAADDAAEVGPLAAAPGEEASEPVLRGAQ